MARSPNPAETLYQAFIAEAVTPPLREAGFRKNGSNYHRRWGDTSQVVNLQLSRGSTWTEKEFYINVGVAFDAICTLVNVPVLDRPKEYECDDRGTRDRLQKLMPDMPSSWVVRVGTEIAPDVAQLRGTLEQLMAELEPIRTLSDYRTHRWFDRFRPVKENAQVLYLLGDLAGALREVQALATMFADRQNANRVEWWIERLRLQGLQSAG